ncbi:MAG: pentapeptide repeat-containing protein [Collinsella intestinalis]
MGSDELLAVFAEGDGYISHVLVEDVELAYECANAATFEHAVFRDCLFEQVDLRECTFRDVVLENCRFIGCVMDKVWLNRVDSRFPHRA